MLVNINIIKENGNETKLQHYIISQSYLTTIRTYLTRWLIRMNLYNLTRMICLNPSDG